MKKILLLLGIAVLGAFPTRLLAGPDTPQGVADAVLDAVAAGDEPDLVELANRRTVDPWLVADALCRAGRADAAPQYAECSKLPEAAALPRWISSRVDGDAFFQAQAALAEGDAHREAARLAVELGWLPGAPAGFMRRGSRLPGSPTTA